jgi:hypothetical protein
MTTAARKPSVFRLRLRSLSDNDADDVRNLRALLKALLRKYRFRVVDLVREPSP